MRKREVLSVKDRRGVIYVWRIPGVRETRWDLELAFRICGPVPFRSLLKA